MLNAVAITRIIVFSLSIVFAIIVLGTASDLTSLTEKYYDAYYYAAALSIAVACIHILSIPVLLIVDTLRTGAFTSLVVFELSWISVLWILWLAAGADLASVTPFSGSCNYIIAALSRACHDFNATEAFAFLNFIILFVYFLFILIASIVASSSGQKVWFSSVKEGPFFRRTTATSAPGAEMKSVASPAPTAQV